MRDDVGMNWRRRLVGSNSFSTAGGFAIRDIVLDPQNFRTAWVITRDRVYRIDNANLTTETITNITGTPGGFDRWWQEISDSTSTIDLRTIELVRARGRSATLLVGGLGGVFRLRNPDPVTAADTAVWTEFGAGMPNVLVRGAPAGAAVSRPALVTADSVATAATHASSVFPHP